MKFNLTTSRHFYKKKDKEAIEHLGFKFEKSDWRDYDFIRCCDDVTTIEINTIEELIMFTKEYGTIVFTENEIEIYNDYRE